MGSVPMLILSGQTRYATGVEATGLKLRSRGIQECDITSIVRPITKYAQLVRKPEEIRYHLERALFAARAGRPGPAWLDIPLDVQGASVETETLPAFDPEEDADLLPPEIPDTVITQIANRLEVAERPVFFPGNGVRLAGAHKEFLELVDLLGVPVVTGVSSVDAIPGAHPLFTGRCGGTGDRAGNFAVQNSDLFLSVGCRQSFSQTGFKTESWAREAFTVMVDADPEEIRKPNLHVSLPVVGDAGAFIRALLAEVKRRGASKEKPLSSAADWRERCTVWKERYPVVTEEHYKVLEPGRTNIYAFYRELTEAFPENAVIIASCGTSRVVGSQVWQPKAGQRFITNSNMASMGFDLPVIIGGAIGAFILVLIDPMHALIFIVFTLVLQTFDGYILKPKLFGESLGVSAVVILITIILGGKIFGVIGILLAIPFAAIMTFLYDEVFLPFLERKKNLREEKALGSPEDGDISHGGETETHKKEKEVPGAGAADVPDAAQNLSETERHP